MMGVVQVGLSKDVRCSYLSDIVNFDFYPDAKLEPHLDFR